MSRISKSILINEERLKITLINKDMPLSKAAELLGTSKQNFCSQINKGKIKPAWLSALAKHLSLGPSEVREILEAKESPTHKKKFIQAEADLELEEFLNGVENFIKLYIKKYRDVINSR